MSAPRRVAPVLNESSAPRDRLARDGERPFVPIAAHEHPATFDLLTAPAVHYSTKWATFLMSLKSLLETGQGAPAPQDVKISDWH